MKHVFDFYCFKNVICWNKFNYFMSIIFIQFINFLNLNLIFPGLICLKHYKIPQPLNSISIIKLKKVILNIKQHHLYIFNIKHINSAQNTHCFKNVIDNFILVQNINLIIFNQINQTNFNFIWLIIKIIPTYELQTNIKQYRSFDYHSQYCSNQTW